MKSMRWAAVPVLLLAATACGSDSGSGSSAKWCDIARSVEGIDDLDDATVSDPTKLKAAFADVSDKFDEAVKAAPSEIKDEVKASADALDTMISALEKADYNFLDVDPTAFTDLTDEMDAASSKIQDYNEKECGITPDSTIASSDDTSGDTSDSGTLPASGTAREQITDLLKQSFGLTDEQASCVADKIDGDAIAELNDNPTAVLNFLDECNIDVADLQPQTS